MIRRELPAFKRDAATTPEALALALDELRAAVSERLSALEVFGRMAVLDDLNFEAGGTLAVGTAPFPMRVQTPFSVAGAWVVLCESTANGEAGVSTTGVTAWVRPVSGGLRGEGNALEIQFISGLTINRKYRVRLAVVGVKNG